MTKQRIVVLRGGTAIAHDGAGHRVVPDADVAYADGRIVYAGARRAFDGAEISIASGKLILPGFVSAGTELLGAALPGTRSRDVIHPELAEAGMRWSLARLLRSGVTTLIAMDQAPAHAAMLAELARQAGMELYRRRDCAESEFATTRSHAAEDLSHPLPCLRMLDADSPSLERLGRFIDAHPGSFAIDLGDDAFAFHHSLREHGKTPVARLAKHGLLRPCALLAGARIMAGDTASAYPYDTDIPLLAAARTTIVATPLADAHAGTWPAAAVRLQAAGGNVAIGANAPPLDMFDELRAWTLTAKAMLGDHEAGTAAGAFRAATTGGADALGRADLGRIAAGARADLVVVDAERIRIGPMFDPLRTLVACADAQMVERVLVAGRVVVDGGAFLGWDEHAVAAGLRERVAASRRAGETADVR